MRPQHPVTVDGTTLSCAAVAAVARDDAPVTVAPSGLARAAAARTAVLAAVGRAAFYGRTTGVGANNTVTVAPGSGHGLRLLRSHPSGAGNPVPAAVARGALAIRLNQLAAGGSGADPAWLEAVASALNAGLAPEFPELGAIGTGDLTGLAATALTLIRDKLARDIAEGRIEAVLPLDDLAYTVLRVAESFHYRPTITGEPADRDRATAVLKAILRTPAGVMDMRLGTNTGEFGRAFPMPLSACKVLGRRFPGKPPNGALSRYLPPHPRPTMRLRCMTVRRDGTGKAGHGSLSV